jgi:outer membrane protein OmpA-like peptidoglycan-associated protein
VAALAADELDGDTFSLGGGVLDHAGTLQLADPQLAVPWSVFGGLGVTYAHDPVTRAFEDGSREQLVHRQLATRVLAGFSVVRRLRLDVEVPYYPWVTVRGQDEAGLGDIRLGGTFVLAGHEGADGVGFGIAPWLTAPTAAEGLWVGSGGVGGGVLLATGAHAGRTTITLDAGPRLRPARSLENTSTGTSIDAGLGVSVRLIPMLVGGVEATSSIDTTNDFAWNTNPTEGHVYFTGGAQNGFVATLGAGTGLVGGVGAPTFRTIAVIGWRECPRPPRDQDKDGVPDKVDRCVYDPEDLDGRGDEDGCPDLDDDGDGINDANDACATEPEDFDDFQDTDGCPDPDNDRDSVPDVDDICPLLPGSPELQGCPDRDQDGVTDAADDCPTEPGPASAGGCPDRDGDRVPDARDECPDQAADRDIDPARSNGCPSKVFVTNTQIVILDKIYFDFNKTTIKRESYAILEQLAKVMNQYPDIRRIEVAGHTDDIGGDASNLKLSQGRAEAVVSWLVSRGGVDAGRLIATGYGESRPMMPPVDELARTLNRRVEFNILVQEGVP